MVKRLGLAVLLLVLGLAPAVQAAPINFSLSFDTGTGITGTGMLTADLIAVDTYGVSAGTLTVTGGAAAGNYSLYLNPSPWNVSTSPADVFVFNNVVYDPANPHFDTNGLMFLEIAGTHEYNIWANSPSNYSAWSWAPGEGYVGNDGFDVTITTVPDPGSSLLLMGMGLAGLLWQRKSTK